MLTPAESSARVGRNQWHFIKNAWARVPAWVKAVSAVVSTGIVIAAGVCMYMLATRSGGYAGRAESYFLVIADKHPEWFTDPSKMSGDPLAQRVTAYLREALAADWLLITGYSLVLIPCAVVLMALAFSQSRKYFSHFVFAAVVAVIAAQVLEDALIYMALNPSSRGWLDGLPGPFWIHAPSAMGTVKWCAFVVAVAGIPAAGLSAIGLAVSHWRRRMYRRQHGTDWWDDVLLPPTPEPTDGDTEAAWRQAYWVPDADPNCDDDQAKRLPMPTALCLSGGGIRSACVAMGAMQKLAGPHDDGPDTRSPPMLDDFDYVISVSGGGFSAGARLLAVQDDPPPPDGRWGGAVAPLGERFSPGSVEFDYLRRHCDYIADSPLTLLRALAEVLKNLLASLCIVASSAIVLGYLIGMFVSHSPFKAMVPRDEAMFPRSATMPACQAIGDLPPMQASYILWDGLPALHGRALDALYAVAVPVAGVVICIVGALFCEWASESHRSTRGQAVFGWFGRRAAVLAVLVFVLSVAGPALMWLTLHRPEKGGVGAIGGIAAVVLLQYGSALISMTSNNKSSLNPSRWLKFVPPEVVRIALVLCTLGVLLIAWLLLLGIVAAYVFNQEVALTRCNGGALSYNSLWLMLGGILLAALLLSSFDMTSLSLHPFYRERLSHTFAVRRRGGEVVEYAADEMTWLDKYGRAQTGGPKFVFVAAAAISDGDIRPAPGLNAVSFVITADYVGGPALGWLNTAALRKASPPRIKRDLTVQAAMAVSAAAFTSAMGRHGTGIRALLALSGARLGTWLPNPVFVRNAQHNDARPFFPKALPSVRGAGYFYRELLGINKFDGRLVQLIDGGHYENLGLVEALRRRCRLIYCIDSGGDNPPLLSGLAEAIRLARFELGIEIIMENDGPFGVENLAPGSADPYGDNHAFHSLNARITKGAVARGKISYPEASGIGNEDARTGWLIIAKAVLWRELPDWVLTYAAEKGGADFPHDNISDQWFSEGQFAAYTEVGRSIAVSAMQVPADGPQSETPQEAAPPHGDAPPPTPAPAMARTVVAAPTRVSPEGAHRRHV